MSNSKNKRNNEQQRQNHGRKKSTVVGDTKAEVVNSKESVSVEDSNTVALEQPNNTTGILQQGASEKNTATKAEIKDLKEYLQKEIAVLKQKLEDVQENAKMQQQTAQRDAHDIKSRLVDFCATKETLNNTKNKLEKSFGEVNQGLYAVKGELLDKADDISREIHDKVNNKVDELKEDTGKIPDIVKKVEVCTGKMNQLDAIYKVLTDKNLELKQNFPASTHDEATIAQLAEYGQTIMKNLELVARWYVRKRPDLEGIEREREHHRIELNERVNEARSKGIKEGRSQVIKELLKKYDDENFAGLFDAEPEGALQRVKILAAYLRNEGVDEKFAKGDVLDINESNIDEYRGLITNVHVGKVRIVAPAYIWDGETVAKARIKAVNEEEATTTPIQ